MLSLAPYLPNDASKPPLILVHGVMSEFEPYTEWGPLVKHLEGYDIYIFRYPTSTADWGQISASLRASLLDMLGRYPDGTRFRAVVSSMGGGLFCSTMQQAQTSLRSRFAGGVSLGTPYLGTPLLNEDYVEDVADQDRSWLGMDSVALSMTRLLYPSLAEKFKWHLAAPACEKLIRSRMVLYGAFITDKPSDIKVHNLKEWWSLNMHRKLLKLDQIIEAKLLWNLNDGLVPVTSALLLGKGTEAKRLIQSPPGLSRARLFPGVDHTMLTGLEGGEVRDIFSGRKRRLVEFVEQDLSNLGL
jgi:pimeloyl-ACP methyl ester carboxylesterase